MDLAQIFLAPRNATHRQYEALRAYFVERLPGPEVARRFGYTVGSLYQLCHQLRRQPDREFFVDFSFAEKNPVKLVGAPARCKLAILNPDQMNSDLSLRLSQLGADQRDPTLTIGSEYANKIVVKCP